MNNRMNNSKGIFIFLIVLWFGFSGHLYAQDTISGIMSSDSLSIDQVLQDVIANFPTVKQAEEAIRAADARISLAKTGYYPDIDATGSYTRLGPTVKISIPDVGSFELYPPNNYAAALNYNQNIYDFGKTSKNVALQEGNKKLSELSLEQVKQNLSLVVVNNFFALAFLQEAIVIKQEELQNLQKHLDFVKKKKETGSATQYELLSTQVRMSAVESQLVDLQTSHTLQLSILNNLLGLPENTQHNVKYTFDTPVAEVPKDSLVDFALKNRDEMKIVKQRTSLAQLRYDLIKTQNNPVLSFHASGGAKNGYIPDLNKPKMNYTVGIGIRVPIYDASRTKYSLEMANSNILSSDFETETAKRTVTNDVVEKDTRLRSARQKVDQYQLQLRQADEAYTLAETNFRAGAITNLDLLDASTTLSESSLLLLKSRIDYLSSVYKLKAALGMQIY